MDNLFGWLQGEKISAKIIQETLQKKLNSYPLSKKINRCPSCEEQIVYVVNELCLVCQKCGRVIECDDYEYFEEENRVRIFTATNFHLKSVLRKWIIYKMFSSSEVDFLGNVIAQFQKMSGKSVNYPYFCTIILKEYLLNAGPTKKKLWNLFLITFQKA